MKKDEKNEVKKERCKCGKFDLDGKVCKCAGWGLKVLVILVLVLGGLWGYSGGLSKVEVMEEQVEPMVMAVKEHKGSYAKTKVPMDEIYKGLLDIGIEAKRGVGLYYDDPAEVEEDDLRSEVGSLIEGDDLQKINLVRERFEVKEVEQMKAMVVEFPIKTMLSYMIGPMKVYPEIERYWMEKGYEEAEYGIEIYDIEGKVIRYIMPIVEEEVR